MPESVDHRSCPWISILGIWIISNSAGDFSSCCLVKLSVIVSLGFQLPLFPFIFRVVMMLSSLHFFVIYTMNDCRFLMDLTRFLFTSVFCQTLPQLSMVFSILSLPPTLKNTTHQLPVVIFSLISSLSTILFWYSLKEMHYTRYFSFVWRLFWLGIFCSLLQKFIFHLMLSVYMSVYACVSLLLLVRRVQKKERFLKNEFAQSTTLNQR